MVGVDESIKQLLLDIADCQEGTLPFRYLGVQLASKKLVIVD